MPDPPISEQPPLASSVSPGSAFAFAFHMTGSSPVILRDFRSLISAFHAKVRVITAKDLLFGPRRSVTGHCPGLEGVQGEEGLKEPHSPRFYRISPLSSSLRRDVERITLL